MNTYSGTYNERISRCPPLSLSHEEPDAASWNLADVREHNYAFYTSHGLYIGFLHCTVCTSKCTSFSISTPNRFRSFIVQNSSNLLNQASGCFSRLDLSGSGNSWCGGGPSSPPRAAARLGRRNIESEPGCDAPFALLLVQVDTSFYAFVKFV